MTPQPQQQGLTSKSFVIHESELSMIIDWLSYRRYDDSDVDSFIDHVRSRPTPSPLEKVLLCFGNYWECPIDEEECEVSDPCHQKAIRDREHDEQVKREAREEVLNEICAINKGDGCCNGQPHGKDCFDCAFIHLRSEVKKE